MEPTNSFGTTDSPEQMAAWLIAGCETWLSDLNLFADQISSDAPDMRRGHVLATAFAMANAFHPSAID